MKKIYFFAGIIFLFQYATIAQTIGSFRVGTSTAVITPKTGSFLAGYDHNRRSSGVHDNLYVKAVVISNSATSLAIFTVDCIGMLYPQLVQVRQAVRQALPVFPVDHIVMSSTHTHSGPDVVGIWGADLTHSGVDSAYLAEIVRTAAQQIIQAYNNQKNAWGQYANTVHGQGWVENISQPAELDRSVTILQFTDRKGRNIATLTNFACHPTILDGNETAVSADFVAGYYESMDKAQGGVNLFLQGAIGGWVQPERVPRTFSAAYEKGYGLSAAVVAALKNPQSIQSNTIAFKRRLISLPVKNEGFRQLSAMHVIPRPLTDSVQTELVLFDLGEAKFATHPGETVPAMGLATKRLMVTDGPKFILGLGMDALGYILKPEFFDPGMKIPHSEYLCTMSLGPQTRDLIMQAIDSMIRGN